MSDNIHHECRKIMAELGKEGTFIFWDEFIWADKEPLTKRLKDVLEDNVDEKYYLSDVAIAGYKTHTERMQERGNGFKFEPTDGNVIASSITTRAGGRPDDNFIDMVGLLDIKGTEQIRRVYGTDGTDGIAATLTTMQGGNQEPKIQVPSATKQGYETATTGDSINLSVPAENPRVCSVLPSYRIRKLTPRECMRLQDFPDDFEIVVSNSQSYKQAGNSMSVNILEMIFRQIILAQDGTNKNNLLDFV